MWIKSDRSGQFIIILDKAYLGIFSHTLMGYFTPLLRGLTGMGYIPDTYEEINIKGCFTPLF